MANHYLGGLSAGAALAIAGPCFAGVNLVTNGGFETGSFFPWSVPPNAPPPQGAFFGVGGAGAHGGNHFARMSSWNLAFMSQFLPDTVPGTEYELEFWLRRAPSVAATFTVRWEGEVVFQEFLTDPALNGWVQFSIPLTSNFSGSLLEFGQAFFPGEFHIDSISVRQVPAPSALPFVALGGLVAFRRTRR